ncbi:MAG: hypothetical protein A4E19_05215 [Nitrospira sp. SG-bin1]|nr:MAG: hypothetical protein A4E19_05215 [Nitrospira sp. SG-bin1]
MQPARPVIVVALSAILALSGCALPVEGLWPPAQNSPAQTVIVSLDTWHAMIAFPTYQADSDQPSDFSLERGISPQHSSLSIQHLFEEWGYAERAWYVEGKTGLVGILRALFWPTEGVVEMGYHDRVWADRTPQPPAERFVFRLSEEGHQRLRQHLRSTLLNEVPLASFGRSAFYPARSSYHLFHTCHQYAAHALRKAGLPISPFWAFNRTSLAWQLRRATKIVGK